MQFANPRLALTFALMGSLSTGIPAAFAQSVPAARAGITPVALAPVRLSPREQANRSIVAVQTVSLGLSQGVIDERQRTLFETLEGEKKAALAAVDAATAQGARALQGAQTRLDQARQAFEAEVDRLVAANQGLQREVEAMRATLLVSLPTLTDEEIRLRQRFADGDRVGTRAIMEKLDADWDAAVQLSLERAQAELALITNIQRAARKRDAAQRAAVSVSKGDAGATSLQVLELWDQAAALDGANFAAHIYRARLAQTIGNLPRARAAAQDGVRAAGGDLERALGQEAVGDIAVLQGDLTEADLAFQESLELFRGLVAGSPDETQLNSNLSTSLSKTGDVAMALGDLAGASAAFSESLGIARRLLAADPSSAEAQRDVSHSLVKIGDVAEARGDLVRATAAYSESLVIDRRLLAADPSSAQAQRDVSVSLNNIGNIAVARGDLAGASAAYSEGLMITRLLAVADPSSAEAQRDVVVSFIKVGDVAMAGGDLAGASAAFAEGLVIARRLSVADPSSAQAQRDVSVSLDRNGDVAEARGDLATTIAAYSEGLLIRRRLSATDPSSAQAQRGLGTSLLKLAQIPGSTIRWAAVAAHWRAMKRNGVLAPRDDRLLTAIEELAAQEAARPLPVSPPAKP